MRKWIVFALLMAVLMAAVPCVAAQGIAVTDASAAPGQIVYLTVSLQESVRGDSMAVIYECDTDLLKPEPTACRWSTEGILQDFGDQMAGVWADDEAKDRKGEICILAFRVQPGANFRETEVKVTLKIKNLSEDTGAFTAIGKVSRQGDPVETVDPLLLWALPVAAVAAAGAYLLLKKRKRA
jgi:hypothetical protein